MKAIKKKAATHVIVTLPEKLKTLAKKIDAMQVLHMAESLIFLKFLYDDFAKMHKKLRDGLDEFEGANPENINEYRALNEVFIPRSARWPHLVTRAPYNSVVWELSDAIDEIERDNPNLKGMFSRNFKNDDLSVEDVKDLIKIVNTIGAGGVLSYELAFEETLRFFSEVAKMDLNEFYTNRSVVELMVRCIRPKQGKLYDPCYGTGGFFVYAKKYVDEMRDDYKWTLRKNKDLFNRVLTCYGQEVDDSAHRYCYMNAKIYGVDGERLLHSQKGSLASDEHAGLKADYIFAHPTPNQKYWSANTVASDMRWHYGKPPIGNANYAWVEHVVHHLNVKGSAAMLMPFNILDGKLKEEKEIRMRLVEAGVIDCVIALPPLLGANKAKPNCVIIMSKAKPIGTEPERELLLIDLKDVEPLRTQLEYELPPERAFEVAQAVFNWRKGKGVQLKNILCKSVPIDGTGGIKEHGYDLTPALYM